MKTFSIMQLGCKVNDYEATYLRNELLNDFKYVEFNEGFDIGIIFSCCVTNNAEAKTRKFIHAARRNNPNAYIVVVGCLAQIKPTLKEFDDVDLIIGSTKKNQLVDLIKQGIKDNKVEDLSNCVFEDLYLENYPGKDRAFLKIQDGCNQYCSYCVIPYARGKERSANHLNIINEAKALAKKFREIVLTGIHTGRYYDGEYHLIDLLKELVKIDGLETIRLSSIELTEINDEMIELIASNNKIANHLHIPVQSLSNSVLKDMHRPYTIEEFITRINYIRERIPNISISTDLIVGFPNESDEIFNKELEMLDKIKFSFIHCFPYSRKTGTLADKMEGHMDNSIKKERVRLVLAKQNDIKLNYYKSFINKDVQVLIEKCIDGISYGYTKEYIYVSINRCLEIGKLYRCIIKEVKDKGVIADVIE